MAPRNFIIVLAAIAVLLPASTTATKYWVGDKSGWTIDYDYQAWASNKVFQVGDTLVFRYTKGHHSVFKVNQTEYQNCTVPEGNPGLTSGHDEITLAIPGKKWYICGVPTHCSAHKQRLAINVVEGGAPAPAPMAPMTPTGPITPTPKATPGAPGNSAYGTMRTSKYQVLFAAAVAFAAFFLG